MSATTEDRICRLCDKVVNINATYTFGDYEICSNCWNAIRDA